jgi:hypothetical protein
LGSYNGTALFGTNVQASNTVYKVASTYQTLDYALVVNGAAPDTRSDALLNTPDALYIGQGDGGGLQQLCGWLRSIDFYNTRIANASLQALTS